MEVELSYLFEGQKQVIHVLENSGSLVDILGKPNNVICPLIGTKIEVVKALGRGFMGDVFLVESKLNGKKKMAMKVSPLEVETEVSPNGVEIDEVSKQLKRAYGVPEAVTQWLNDYKDVLPGAIIRYPLFAFPCKTKTEKTFVIDSSEITFPKGSYICYGSSFSEFAIASLCGQLYSRGLSAHFLETYNFAICKENNPNSYTFTELADGTVSTHKNCFVDLPPKFVQYEKSFIFQVLHTIAMYQHHYKISHNDLHLGNILFTIVDENTLFNGQKIYEADWFHYVVKDIDLYLPSTPYIPKITDFGVSTKWSKPIVTSTYIFEAGTQDPEDTPTYYIPQYDSLRFLSQIGKINSLLFEHLKVPSSVFSSFNGNPLVGVVDEYKNTDALSILTNRDITGEFMKKPSSGTIVTLGILV